MAKDLVNVEAENGVIYVSRNTPIYRGSLAMTTEQARQLLKDLQAVLADAD